MPKFMEGIEELREALRPTFEADKLRNPGVSDVECCNCGCIWRNEIGMDGKIYCCICLGRGRDRP